MIVFANAKILIRKQFTTIKPVLTSSLDCFCQCKDTNSKAIHNRIQLYEHTEFIVFANAKILIRKQFTTILCERCAFQDCFCQCKDTNSKAIHN